MTTTPGTQPATPNVLTGTRAVEPVLRDFLAYELEQIRSTVDDPSVTFLAELFAAYGPSVVAQIKNWFRDHTNIPVVINYPHETLGLPFICVVSSSHNEKSEQAYLGDYGGQAKYGVLGGAVPPGTIPTYTRDLLSIPETCQTQVYVASGDPNLTLYLWTVVKALVYANKLKLLRYLDMQNLVLTSGDLEFHPELFPEFAYFKTVGLRYDTSFDLPLNQEHTIIGGVNIGIEAVLLRVQVAGVTSTVRPFDD